MSKIFTLEEMADIAARMRKEGKMLVQAHGTFDLLHVGHVKYLQHAKTCGDLLVVTLTADKYVNKGPNRPIFPEGLRADMLAALQCVDYVVIAHAPDAVDAIAAIKPDFYIKGHDYKNPDGDITGKIHAERLETENGGGRFLIADTAQFSSTELINRHVNIYEPHTKAYLDKIRGNGGLDGLLAMLEAIKDTKVLIVGEGIDDVYKYVVPIAKSSKEPIICTRYQDAERFSGGVKIMARMLEDFCGEVRTISWDREIIKERFVDPAYTRKMFEVCYMNDDPILPDEEQDVLSEIQDRIDDYDVVIIVDYGHGMISPAVFDLLRSKAKFLAINAQTNSNNLGFNLITKYAAADYVCIDLPEARLAVGDKHGSAEDVIRKLSTKINCKKFIITNGKHGCVTYNGALHTIPAIAKNVTDTMGAGDAFLALTAPLLAKGFKLDEVGFIGNVAGGAKTTIIGHKRPVNKVDVVKALTGVLK